MKNNEFDELVAIMDRLREPGGCPWDREQDYRSLRSYLIEECYEVAEALDRDDREALREELGDLLLQIVFLARLGKEEGRFTIDDVVRGIVEKMIRRHPHVFGDDSAETSEEVLRQWEEIKSREKAEGGGPPRRSVLDGIPVALPALIKAQRLGTKAARVGFDWKEPADILTKVREELAELEHALADDDRDAVAEELGDVLFTLAMLARRKEVDPEAALERTNIKFRSRFGHVEQELERRGRKFDGTNLDELEALWEAAKAAERL